jgi:cytosine deaminase
VIDLVIRACRIEDASELVDVRIDAGRIVSIAPARTSSEPAGRREIEADGRVVIPGFVNAHVHLDKAFVGGLAPSGLMLDGVALGTERKRQYTREDIKERVRRALDLAVRHGTTALRSPVDVDPIVGVLCVEAVAEVREEYRDRIDVQILAFPQEGFLGVDGMHDLMRRAMAAGADVVGGRPHGDPVAALDYDRHINAIFEIAEGRPVDMSVDAIFPARRSAPPDPDALGVSRLAEAVIRHAYPAGAVTAHHVLALSAVGNLAASRVIDRVCEAGMNIITLPTSNLFTEGRADDDNPRRGLTRVKEFLRAGVNLAVGTDNLDDTYLPFANMNLLLEAHVCACAAHLGSKDERRALLLSVTHNAARVLALEGYGTAVGCRADLVVLDTTDHGSIVMTQPEKTHVIKAGRVVAQNGAALRLGHEEARTGDVIA